jgi:hypothetical protein
MIASPVAEKVTHLVVERADALFRAWLRLR